MKISVILDELNPSFREALKLVKGANLEWVELRVIDGINVAQLELKKAREYALILKDLNLRVCAIASPLLKCYLPGEEGKVPPGDQFGFRVDDYDSHLKIMEKVFDLAKIFETKLVRVFSFWKASPLCDFKARIIASYLEPLITRASESGLILILENEPSCYVQKLTEAQSIVKLVGSENFKILWDPGNAKLCGENELEVMTDTNIIHVHLKNFIRRNGETVFVSISSGEVDIHAVLDKLKGMNYDGAIVLEPCRGGKISQDEFREEVRALNSLLKG